MKICDFLQDKKKIDPESSLKIKLVLLFGITPNLTYGISFFGNKALRFKTGSLVSMRYIYPPMTITKSFARGLSRPSMGPYLMLIGEKVWVNSWGLIKA